MKNPMQKKNRRATVGSSSEYKTFDVTRIHYDIAHRLDRLSLFCHENTHIHSLDLVRGGTLLRILSTRLLPSWQIRIQECKPLLPNLVPLLL